MVNFALTKRFLLKLFSYRGGC